MKERLNLWFGKTKQADRVDITSGKIPKHVAVIMDGNGRWARKRGLPRVAGHHQGMKNVKQITMTANDLGIEILTLYAFSTENWKRPKDEVDFLMKLPQEFLGLEIEELIKNNVQIRMMGSREGLPEHALRPIEEGIERTKNNTGLILNFALNYGGRKELLYAAKQLCESVSRGELKPEELTEEHMEAVLQSSGLPDPDLLIRTSGELRVSNFMLWQMAYTEMWFTDALWPEFTKEHFYEAIAGYQQRARRFGGI
ncbi:isoprenyl transferase [Paenibacillus turpanensis]|uniref:isoprenyl transferase n=1 Tax=Paenibacillus turpanensis TaxID=2689078 RepID=UPI00140DEEB6|nr:isoprenyl transferase [Paenibacillus turpanensis]